MHRIILIYLCLLTCPPLAQSASVNLTQALHLGLTQNADYLSVAAQTDAAHAQTRLIESQRLPRLTFTEDLTWTNEPGTSLFISLNQQRLQLRPDARFYNEPDTHNDFQSRLQLSQSVYDPQLRFGRQAAARQAAAAVAGQEAGAELLAFNILRAYLDVQLAAKMLDWADAALQEGSELKRLATERELAGTGLKADSLSAEVRLSASLQQRISAETHLQITQWQLALLTGQDAPLQIEEPLTVADLPSVVTTDHLKRPDLQALELQFQAAEQNTRQKSASWQPKMQAGASWTLHDRDFPLADSTSSWLVGAGLSWTLFDGFGRSHATAKARAEERSLFNRHRQAVRQAEFDQQTALLQSAVLRQQYQVSQSTLAAAQESYQLLLNRYRQGLTSLAELLSVQVVLEKTRADVSQSEVQLIRSLAQQHYLQGHLLSILLPEEGKQ